MLKYRYVMRLQDDYELWFKKNFASHYKELVVYAHKYIYDLDESEDIVQEVFLQLWERRNSIEFHTSVRSYMYTMVRNRCLNHLNSIKITDNLEVLHKLFESEILHDTENKESLITRKIEDLNKAVNLMPKSMREVFELKYLSNFTCAEIAMRLNITPNTVKTQLKRAKARILTVVHYSLFFFFHIFL